MAIILPIMIMIPIATIIIVARIWSKEIDCKELLPRYKHKLLPEDVVLTIA